jgi:hypothetical protein
MDRFEYRTLLLDVAGMFGKRLDTARITKELNALGADGWELVSSKSSTVAWGSERSVVCIFKRKLRTPVAPR